MQPKTKQEAEQILNTLDGHHAVLGGAETLQLYGNANNALQLSIHDRCFERNVLVGRNKGVVLDYSNALLIDDQQIADKVLAPLQNRFMRHYPNANIEGMTEHISFPEYKRLFPELGGLELGGLLQVVGYGKYGDTATAWLFGSDAYVCVNADKLAFMKKHLPDSEMYAASETPRQRAITFVVDGQSKGLLMPVFYKGLPQFVLPTTIAEQTAQETEQQLKGA